MNKEKSYPSVPHQSALRIARNLLKGWLWYRVLVQGIWVERNPMGIGLEETATVTLYNRNKNSFKKLVHGNVFKKGSFTVHSGQNSAARLNLIRRIGLSELKSGRSSRMRVKKGINNPLTRSERLSALSELNYCTTSSYNKENFQYISRVKSWTKSPVGMKEVDHERFLLRKNGHEWIFRDPHAWGSSVRKRLLTDFPHRESLSRVWPK